MSGSILIADGDRGRARKIAESCGERGFTTTVAAHGAAALEAALADVPDVVVAPLDLALIDGRKLAEILRANPRAQGVRFLFLGQMTASDRHESYFDEVLPPSAEADEISTRIEALLAQRARIDAAGRDAEADRELEGRLSQIPLTDLLQLFHMNRRTGMIEISRRDSGGREERGTVWVRDGNLIQASAGNVEGEKALFRLLAWRDGSFSFTPNRAAVAPKILTPTRALLMEGMRQLDEWDRLRSSLPSSLARVELKVARADLPSGVHPLTQEVLLLLEIYNRVGDVVDHCTHSDYQVLRTIQTLAERGMIEVREETPAPLAEKVTEGLFTPAQVRRLRDWLQLGRPRGSEGHEAKLLLFSDDVGATRDFVRMLGQLPGMQIADEFLSGTHAAEDLLPLGRLTIDRSLSILLMHVPVGVGYAPIWPVVAHGSLGSLVILSSSEREAEERIAPVTEALRRLPLTRVFHLLLLRKGERLVPEELQEKMARLDDSSLFLLPLESGKDTSALLRTMLGRILP